MQDNSNLTAITNPTSTEVFTLYSVFSCNLTGTLDLSTLSALGGEFRADSNPNLTTIINPTSTQTFSEYLAYSCDLTGTLDVSTLSALGGQFRANGNPNLTTIINPTSTQPFSQYSANDCDLGYVDITTLIFASDADIAIYNNSMTAAEVNQILVDLDATMPAPGTGLIDISGSNAAPDSSSGGFDGITARNSLVAAGYTVTTS